LGKGLGGPRLGRARPVVGQGRPAPTSLGSLTNARGCDPNKYLQSKNIGGSRQVLAIAQRRRIEPHVDALGLREWNKSEIWWGRTDHISERSGRLSEREAALEEFLEVGDRELGEAVGGAVDEALLDQPPTGWRDTRWARAAEPGGDIA
jgi:hypothetical protein